MLHAKQNTTTIVLSIYFHKIICTENIKLMKKIAVWYHDRMCLWNWL